MVLNFDKALYFVYVSTDCGSEFLSQDFDIRCQDECGADFDLKAPYLASTEYDADVRSPSSTFGAQTNVKLNVDLRARHTEYSAEFWSHSLVFGAQTNMELNLKFRLVIRYL